MSNAAPKTTDLAQTIGADFLAGIMAARDLNSRDMDHLLGFRHGLFAEMRCKNFPSEQARALVENRMAVRIWETEQRFNLRMACQRRYHFDPCLLSVPELRRWVRQLGIADRLKPQANRDELIDAILAHFAANPKTK
jgi:hypothetical protein